MIKRLEKIEIEEVMDIWLKTNIKTHSFIPKEYWIKNYNIVKEEYFPISKTFICKEENIIKGFISIIDSSFIGALFVLEEYQGQGIGKKLLNHCKSLYSNLELEVYIKNISSVNFYKYCGFTIKEEKKHEDSGFMEYIMTWEKNDF
ncbi:N-acetyltransferase [Clostridium sporogenes]|uniref:N-acetyltransferase n=1 Tax=Clostridium botulinum TaxID=1491 RepID=A0A6M0SXE9_CLOBO|nr:N-acetyltransferase [Clostridium sporogenes]NFA60176.1 N-acetyltransferase [Clostridium botulinum]NFI72849.1 N-acetyltransferase [Clostridium sporogenes]NFL73156.1 N-acetyltransferase [Clostridium sporogenes]NFM23377.1 N-acetyltransferase [Clostridium sporogenes]NFP60262.1 N-acetyltransferase [Clostridium sporogenes]